jgi:hypothetical protein
VAETGFQVGNGLHVDDVERTTQAEIDSDVMTARRNRVPPYATTADTSI